MTVHVVNNFTRIYSAQISFVGIKVVLFKQLIVSLILYFMLLNWEAIVGFLDVGVFILSIISHILLNFLQSPTTIILLLWRIFAYYLSNSSIYLLSYKLPIDSRAPDVSVRDKFYIVVGCVNPINGRLNVCVDYINVPFGSISLNLSLSGNLLCYGVINIIQCPINPVSVGFLMFLGYVIGK